MIRNDITSADIEETGFDLIHARTVLEHLTDRQMVVNYLASLPSPGGTLLLEDSDLSPTTLAVCGQYATNTQVSARTTALLAAGAQLMTETGADPQYGPKLGAALESAGLCEVAMELRISTVRGDPVSVLSLSFERLREPVVAAGLLDPAQCDAALVDLADAALRLPGVPMVAASGRKPARASAVVDR